MFFTEPIPYDDAIESQRVRSVMGMAFGTRELRDVIPVAARDAITKRAFFSANTEWADYLGSMHDWINRVLTPEVRQAGDAYDRGQFRLAMRNRLNEIGFVPTAEDANTLRDLGSDERLNLIFNTNVQTAQGWAQHRAEQIALDTWPARELYRLEHKRVERGSPDSHSEGWGERWMKAAALADDPVAARIYTETGRMVARKDSRIWSVLGDPAVFPDALGNDYSPFAFGTGMWDREIPIEEWRALSGEDKVAPVRPDNSGLNGSVRAGAPAAPLAEVLATALKGIARLGADNVLRMVNA